MPNKPPAFQFYAKDWRSSATVRSMDDHEKAVYIDMLAAAWDSDEPGTLPLDLTVCAKVCGRNVRSLRSFLSKFGQTFEEVSGKLVNEKLHEQWLKYKELSEKRSSAANSRHHAIASHLQGSAVAFASAPAKSKDSVAPPRSTRFDSKTAAVRRDANTGRMENPPTLTSAGWQRAFGEKKAAK
jgi:uncharacterized protein YdaU (DUF1376 family)